MARLIDADKLLEQIARIVADDGMNATEKIGRIIIAITDAPTVDAVEVVRCKDCEHWKNAWKSKEIPEAHGYCHLEDADNVIVGRWEKDSCSYGERVEK